MNIGRRAFIVAATLGSAFLVGGATTSLDIGRRDKRESLLIAGSSEFQPYAVKVLESFGKADALVDALLEAGGTEPALLALKRGAIDMAFVSRELKPQEDDKLTRGHLLARDGIALVAHPSNPVSDITKAQAIALLSGEIGNWAALGGPSEPVTLLRRKPDAGTQKALEKLVLEHGEMASGATVLDSGVKMREAVAATPQAFGFLALHDITPDVKVLAVNGVPMSRATILSGRYSYTRSFFAVTYGEPKPVVKRFLSFALGAAGQGVLAGLGLISVR